MRDDDRAGKWASLAAIAGVLAVSAVLWPHSGLRRTLPGVASPHLATGSAIRPVDASVARMRVGPTPRAGRRGAPAVSDRAAAPAPLRSRVLELGLAPVLRSEAMRAHERDAPVAPRGPVAGAFRTTGEQTGRAFARVRRVMRGLF